MKVAELRSSLKKNNIIFFTYKKITDHDYRSNFFDYLRHKCYKNRDRVKYEISLIRDYWKCDPAFYFRYRLFEKNLSTEDLLDYIPPYYFYNFYMPSLYKDAHISLTGSKIRMNEFFESRKIDTPAIKAVVRNGNIFGSSGELITYSKLKDRIRNSPANVHFLKPDHGRGGKGIMKIERTGDELFIDNEFIDSESFRKLTLNNTFVIQEGIRQRSDLRAIYPASVNTLRVITQSFDGKAQIIAVVLRMGRNGSFVDNSSFGGVFSPVEINSGKLADHACLLHDPKKFDSHPDTGFRFSGFKLEGWDKIRQDVLRFVEKAPEFPDVAWDIALLDDKIMAIEINLNYGLDHLQCSIGGMRRKLNVTPAPAYLQTGIRKYFLHP